MDTPIILSMKYIDGIKSKERTGRNITFDLAQSLQFTEGKPEARRKKSDLPLLHSGFMADQKLDFSFPNSQTMTFLFIELCQTHLLISYEIFKPITHKSTFYTDNLKTLIESDKIKINIYAAEKY